MKFLHSNYYELHERVVAFVHYNLHEEYDAHRKKWDDENEIQQEEEYIKKIIRNRENRLNASE